MRALVPLAVAVAVAACGGDVVFPASGAQWPAAPAYPWAASARLGITDSGDDTLAMVGLDLPPVRLGMPVIGDNPVEVEGPHDLAPLPSGDVVLVVLSNAAPGTGTGPHGAHGLGTVPGSVLALDARTLEKRGEAQVDKNAGEILLSADGRTAWLTHYDLAGLARQVQQGLPEAAGFSSLAVIDTASMARPPLVPVCATAHDLAASADGTKLYVTCAFVDEVAVFDAATHAVQRFPTGPDQGAPLQPACLPYAIERAPVDGTLWISCNKSGEVRAFDPATNAVDPRRSVFVHGVPMFGDFLDDGRTLVVPHQGDDALSFVDTVTSTETALVALPRQACLNARNAAVAPDGKTVWVVCEGDHVARPGTAVAVDVDARAVVGFVELGLYPTAIAFLPPAP